MTTGTGDKEGGLEPEPESHLTHSGSTAVGQLLDYSMAQLPPPTQGTMTTLSE